MDIAQQQINILTTKVESLSQRIEQLSSKVSEVVVECKFGADQAPPPELPTYSGYRSAIGYHSDALMEHKDILMDADSLESSAHGERQLAPEVQIQRLTAQLTAAYNRIAALEEQLLSKRVY